MFGIVEVTGDVTYTSPVSMIDESRLWTDILAVGGVIHRLRDFTGVVKFKSNCGEQHRRAYRDGSIISESKAKA